MKFHKHIPFVVLLVTVMLAVSLPAQAATFNVDRTDDSATATACDDAIADDCSLRGAILAANALSEASTINVPAGTYVLSQFSTCPYRLKSIPTTFTSPQIPLCLSKDITIQGAGSTSTIIDADHRARALLVGADAVAELRGVTLKNGIGSVTFFPFHGGGGILNHGTLTLVEALVSDNELLVEYGSGVGISNYGTLTLRRSAVMNNVSLAQLESGGGISNSGSSGAILVVSDSTIAGNAVAVNGGGIHNSSTATIINSTISGNTANANGGGIANLFDGQNAPANLTVINSTISGNTGRSGGGVWNGGQSAVLLNNVTITNNSAAFTRGGGGINNAWDGPFAIQNTLIAGNRDLQGAFSAPDCSAGEVISIPVTSQGYNLIQDPAHCLIVGDTTGNVTAVDPQLGLLLDNGGVTKTHALADSSPAIDAGSPVEPGSGGNACTATDQRGFIRPLGAACDIGAFERFDRLALTRIVPSSGSNAGVVTAFLSGNGFVDGAIVKLVRVGQPDVIGNPVHVDTGGSAIAATFDLAGQPIGRCDVVVTNPDGTSATLPGGFLIEAARAPELWTDIVGSPNPRLGRPARFTVFFGNRGNVDAVGVPLTVSVPADYPFRIFFSITPPPPQPGQVLDDWSQVPVIVDIDPQSGIRNVPLLLPVIPAGFTGSFQIELTPPTMQNTGILASFGDPLLNPNLDPQLASKAVAGAQAYLQDFEVTIPPALIPDLERYVRGQYQRAIDDGRTAFIGSLGTRLQAYSLSQLFFDLIFVAASGAADNTAVLPAAIRAWLSARSHTLIAALSHLRPAAADAAGVVPCTGGLVTEGQECTPVERLFPPDIPLPPGCDLKNSSTWKNCKPTEAHCSALPTHEVIRTDNGEAFCVPLKRSKCPEGGGVLGSSQAKSACKRWPLAPVRSVDPNEKVGSLGVTPAHFLVSATPLSYTVFFENMETATAAAQEVVITDQLDVDAMDLDTFSLGPISFGEITILPPSAVQQYSGGVDLRPDQNLIVTVEASLDRNTGIITWRFASVDPATGQLTDDPVAGFLPPDVNPPEGDGSVVFTVKPKSGLGAGATICNQANIVFDVNAPILTPQWCNTIDETPPSSRVSALAPAQSSPSFTLDWSGTDMGAGIADYTVFVSENGGPFTPFQNETTETSATFAGEPGRTYAFYSVASDLVGNAELAPVEADATTRIAGGPCVGDCNGDGRVVVSELVTAVRIALDLDPLERCSAADCRGAQAVTIDCLVSAVGAALNGCP